MKKKIILLLSTAVLLAGCGGKQPTDPQGIARGSFATGAAENQVVTQRLEGGVFYVERNYFPFAKNRTEVLMSFADFAKAVFDRSPDVQRVSVQTNLPFDDGTGNYSWQKASVIEMSRGTAGRINWDNFLASNLPKVADSYWEAPFLRD